MLHLLINLKTIINLDHCDILHNKPNNEHFYRKGSICRACLAITGGIEGTSRERRYDELALKDVGAKN